jgi:uncharacterized membrane protein YobD (UPF0266 family)
MKIDNVINCGILALLIYNSVINCGMFAFLIQIIFSISFSGSNLFSSFSFSIFSTHLAWARASVVVSAFVRTSA